MNEQNIDGGFYFVQLYSPNNCGNCATEESELDKVAQLFKGIIKIRKLNVETQPMLKQAVAKKNPNYFLVKGDIKDYVEYNQKISRISVSKFIL